MSVKFAINDARQSIGLARYWLYSAFIKLQIEHKKTFLSLFWEPLTVFFVAGTLSIVWSQILKVENPADYFFYILTGFSVWSLLLAKLINRAVASLSTRSAELTTSAKPILSLPLEDIAYSFLNFLTTAPFLLALSIYYHGFSLGLIGFFLLGLLLIWLTAVGLCLTLGVLAFFYRDVMQLIKAVMRLGFLVTPIIWKPERLGKYEDLVWLNPFYSFIDFCRAPLMGQMPHNNSIIIAVGLSIVLPLLGFFVLSLMGGKIRRGVFNL